MSGLHLRPILAAVAFITLFLPADPEVGSNWLFSLWSSMEILARMSEADLINFIIGLGILLYLWAVPILILLNVCLVILRNGGVKIFYRIFLLIMFPVMWCATFIMAYRGIGFWANPIVVSAAALLEVFLIKGWLEEPGK